MMLVRWFLVEVGVGVKGWYGGLYDVIERGVSWGDKVSMEEF